MFDSDMSGGISHGEFDRTLRKRLNLRFDATLLDGGFCPQQIRPYACVLVVLSDDISDKRICSTYAWQA